MLFFHLRSIAVLLAVIMVSAAGCTDSVPFGSPEPPRQSAATITTTRGTTIPQPAPGMKITVTESPPKIFNGEYRWAEYRINNTVTFVSGSRTQWEYTARIQPSSEVYHGIPAIHETITISGDTVDWRGEDRVIIPHGFQATQDLFYDGASKRFLGGSFDSARNGADQPQLVMPEDKIYCENCRPSWLGINPFSEMNISLSAEGEDAVTVPAGTYPDARKYSGYLPDGTPITFWIVPGIPVPVQYRANMGLDGEDPMQSFELRGWG